MPSRTMKESSARATVTAMGQLYGAGRWAPLPPTCQRAARGRSAPLPPRPAAETVSREATMSTTTPTSPTGRVALSRTRRYTIRSLLAVATLCTVAAIFAIWADRQALNADNWADTSSAMLDNGAIRTQVSGFLVDQVYANVDVAEELSSSLPKRLKPLAGPAAGSFRDFAQNSTDRALGRPRIQQLWKDANRATAKQFIAIAKDDSKAITSSGNAVVLDLRAVVIDLASR